MPDSSSLLQPKAITLAVLLAFTLPTVSAHAQTATSQTVRSYAIASGPLEEVLTRFTASAGIALSFDPALVSGLRSNGLNGSYTGNQGLQKILQDSGLAAETRSDGSYTLRKLPVSSVQQETTLAPVTVTSTVQNDGFVITGTHSATKTDIPLREVPQSVSVISKKQIEMQNAQTVSEVLRYAPGVTIETYGPDPKGYDWILMRGFNVMSNSGYLDGLRQMAHNYSYFRTDPYELESVTVLRGPSSALYGQSDAGGIVNKTSKKPVAERVRELEVEYGSHDRAQLAADIGGALNDEQTVLYRLVGVARDGNTQFRYGNGAKVADDRLMIAPSITFAPNTDTRLTVKAQALRDDSGGTIQLFAPTNILLGEPGFNRSVQEQKSIGYELSHRVNDTWTLRQNLHYGKVSFLLDNVRLTGANAGGLVREANRFDERLDAFALDNQAEANFVISGIQHKVLVGLDYTWSDADVKRFGNVAPQLNPLNPVYGAAVPTPTTVQSSYRERYTQTGAYLQDQVRLTDRLIATIGARYDWLDQKTHNRLNNTDVNIDIGRFSGRAGLTWLSDTGWAPYVSYSESFVPNSGLSSSGKTFDPSVGRQWEAGIKYQPVNRNMLFTAAVFDIVKSNVLTTELNAAGAATGFNVASGEVRSRGFETEAKLGLASGWDLTGSYTYTDAKITKDNTTALGKKPTMVPEHQASGWLNYTVTEGSLQGLSVGGGVRYVGSSFGNRTNTIKVDNRTLFDLGTSYRFSKHSTLLLNVTNLFDKAYFTTCDGVFSCYEGDRRSVSARLKLNF